MSVHARLAALAPRERRLLAVAGVVVLVVLGGHVTLAVRDDLGTLRARVAGRERELDRVRALAAHLRAHAPMPGATPGGPPPLTHLEDAALRVVGRERLAGMSTASATRVALRVRSASLSEIVHLLHAVESGPGALPVVRLELRKHPDDGRRFEATLEVASPEDAR